MPKPSRPLAGKYLETMSWKEAEAAIPEHKIILLPVGARCKEHGLHLPLNNDWLIAEYLTRRVLEQCRVLALPTVQYGHYPAFVEYPGSVNIARETFRDTIMDICRSLRRHGARKFYVLNTGISTNRSLEPARHLLAAEDIVMEYTNLSSAAVQEERSIREQEAGTHADEIETSMMLYLAPKIVKMALAQKDIHRQKAEGGLTRNPHATSGIYSPTGAWGDPTLATVEKGKLVTEALVKHIVEFVQAFAAKDFTPSPPNPRYL